MRQKISEQLRDCREHAHGARRSAEMTADPALRRDFLEMEKHWLGLARSYRVAEHVTHFIASNSRRRRRFAERVLAFDRADDALRLRKVNAFLSQDGNLDALFECIRLVSVVEYTDDAIISKNLDGIVTSWNTGAERLFGYSAEEAIGQSVTILMPPDYEDEEKAILERIRRGDSIERHETIRWRKDGSLIDILLTVSPIRDVEGKVVGASKIARDITEHKRSEARIAVLAREAEHRAKNLLASVRAIVRLSQCDTPDGFKKAIDGRIAALANVHSLFAHSRWSGAELGSLVKQELSPYSHDGEMRTRIGGPTVLLKPDLAQAIAMALHELATNAAKYGALSVPEGQVSVEWSRTEDAQLALCWMEMGGPPVIPPTRKGFGTAVLDNMMQDRAGGRVQLNWRAEGLTCEMTLPT